MSNSMDRLEKLAEEMADEKLFDEMTRVYLNMFGNGRLLGHREPRSINGDVHWKWEEFLANKRELLRRMSRVRELEKSRDISSDHLVERVTNLWLLLNVLPYMIMYKPDFNKSKEVPFGPWGPFVEDRNEILRRIEECREFKKRQEL